MYDGKKRSDTSNIPVKRRLILSALSYVFVFIVGSLTNVHTLVKVTDLSSTKVEKSTSSSPLSSTSSREYGNGWQAVEVFYGKTDAFERKYPQATWRAQVNQDLIVSRLFREKRNGYFLDLAANDPVHISNTYALEQNLDWSGICMEPNPDYWFPLAHRRCHVVGAVVGELRNDPVVFQKTGDGTRGGIVGAEFDNQVNLGGETRYTVPLHEILDRFQAPKVIDYLSLDVEGAETLIMKHFPFDRYSFNVLTVERPKDDLKELLEKKGYELLATICHFGETLWVRKAFKESLDIASVEEFFYTGVIWW